MTSLQKRASKQALLAFAARNAHAVAMGPALAVKSLKLGIGDHSNARLTLCSMLSRAGPQVGDRISVL